MNADNTKDRIGRMYDGVMWIQNHICYKTIQEEYYGYYVRNWFIGLRSYGSDGELLGLVYAFHNEEFGSYTRSKYDFAMDDAKIPLEDQKKLCRINLETVISELTRTACPEKEAWDW